MRILLIALGLLFTTSCFAQGDLTSDSLVKLYRITDRATGEERGICYSDIKGNPPTIKAEYDAEVISEDQKLHYIELYEKQEKAKQDSEKDKLNTTKKSIKTKMKDILTPEELDVLVGKTY